MVVSGNTFANNGHRPGGRTDLLGNPLDDGLHITSGGGITVAGNRTSGNADYGIEAPGAIDGGGNTSTGDPSGCLGVTCAN
jgi:hypothetical protein